MSIELTIPQAEALDVEGTEAVVIDPRTKQTFRLEREEIFQKMQALLYDDSEWTPAERDALAAEGLAALDDEDYSYYLDKSFATNQ
jgi:hypothetical protein